MNSKDIILVNKDDLRKTIAILEDAGIEVSILTSRYLPSCC